MERATGMMVTGALRGTIVAQYLRENLPPFPRDLSAAAKAKPKARFVMQQTRAAQRSTARPQVDASSVSGTDQSATPAEGRQLVQGLIELLNRLRLLDTA